MRPRHQARSGRPVLAVLAGILALLGLFQWFCGFYVVPPAEGARGRTALVWRTGGEPFFNSPARSGAEGGPAGVVLVPRLPYWGWAYRQSLGAVVRDEPPAEAEIVVGATPGEPERQEAAVAAREGGSVSDAAAGGGAVPVASPAPRASEPSRSPTRAADSKPRARPSPPRAAAKPRATPAPARAAAKPKATPAPARAAAARPSPSPTPRTAASSAQQAAPAASPAVRADAERLERLRRELERIRRGETRAGAAPGSSGAGGGSAGR
jgi:hypothetical protein